MAHVHVNELNRFHEITGEAHLLVLAHGACMDHSFAWQLVGHGLAESIQTLAFDRRGHSRSERSLGQGSRRQEEDELAALIETLRPAPFGTEPRKRPRPLGDNGPEDGSGSSLSMHCVCCSQCWSRRPWPRLGRPRHESWGDQAVSGSVPGDGPHRREARVVSRMDVHIWTTTACRHRTLEAANG